MQAAGGGFGGLALGQILGTGSALGSTLNHVPKAKRVIQLFMNGGVSQMDTFDHKPELAALDGQKFDPGDGRLVESVTNSPGFKVLKSPFAFQRHGECGRSLPGERSRPSLAFSPLGGAPVNSECVTARLSAALECEHQLQ